MPGTPKPNILRRLYDWVLRWADTPYGTPALAVLAFLESSFFPVPPDPLLMALSLSKVKRSLWYAAVCSVASVLGGMLGYLIGYGLWVAVSDLFFAYVPGFTQVRYLQGKKVRNSRWQVILRTPGQPAVDKADVTTVIADFEGDAV